MKRPEGSHFDVMELGIEEDHGIKNARQAVNESAASRAVSTEPVLSTDRIAIRSLILQSLEASSLA